MNRTKFSQLVTGAVVVLLAGCSSPILTSTATPVLPTSTPLPPTVTPVPPTSTPLPPTVTPVPPTSAPVGVIVSPKNPVGHVGGYWKAIQNQTFNVKGSDTKGNQAVLDVQGRIEWDAEGKLVEGAENFIRIQTKADPNRWYKIVSSEVLDGVLILTAEDGIYTFFSEGRTTTPTSRASKPATITSDGVWKGQASLIVTGFNPMNFGASIYQDTRNYTIQTAK